MAVSPPCALPVRSAEAAPPAPAAPCWGVADALTVRVPLVFVPTVGMVTDGRSPVTAEGEAVTGTGVVTLGELGTLDWPGAAGGAGSVGVGSVGVGIDGAGAASGAGEGTLSVGETVMAPDALDEPPDALGEVTSFPAPVAPTAEADAVGASPAAGVATAVGGADRLDGGAATLTSAQACAELWPRMVAEPAAVEAPATSSPAAVVRRRAGSFMVRPPWRPQSVRGRSHG